MRPLPSSIVFIPECLHAAMPSLEAMASLTDLVASVHRLRFGRARLPLRRRKRLWQPTILPCSSRSRYTLLKRALRLYQDTCPAAVSVKAAQVSLSFAALLQPASMLQPARHRAIHRTCSDPKAMSCVQNKQGVV